MESFLFNIKNYTKLYINHLVIIYLIKKKKQLRKTLKITE